MIIFVTVGNGKFDALVKEIDLLKSTGKIKEDIVIQLGHGTYKPKNCRWFAFDSDLDKYYQDADLVISHGGPGCIFENLRAGRRLIGIPNRQRTDPNHQVEYLKAIAQESRGLIYCDRVQDLKETLEKANIHKFERYSPPACKIGEIIDHFLN